MHSYSGIRATQSAGADGGHLAASPYHRPLTVSNTVDKSSILWKDFLSGVKKRKLLIRKLYDAANESSASISVIKKALLDLRQQTLSVVEDALEIEYRSRMDLTKVAKGSLRNARLPPISSFKAMEEKEDIFSLVDMMSDVDDLFHVPNIRVMLPASFPEHRNPFMLGKSVDEMATITPPHPEPGNAEEELKVLELLRYKRASRALLRAEAQVANRLPISLYDVEKLLTKMTDDFNLEKLLRCVCTLLDNEHAEYADEPNLACLLRPVFNLEAHEFLNRLNAFKGVRPIRIDAQIQVRHSLREANLEYIDDPTVQYLMDWLDIVLNPSKLMTGSADSQPDVARGPSATQSRLNKRSLETISEVEWNGNSEVFPIQQSSSFGGQPIPPIAPKSPQVKSVPYYMQDNDDLISEVGSKGYVNTHENIHVEERPKSKMQKRADGPPSPPRSPPPPRLPLEVLKRGSSREGSRSQQQQKRPTSTGGTPSAHDVGVGGETEGETDKEPSRATAEAGSSPLAHSPTHNEPAIPKRNRKKIAPKILRDDDDEQTIKQNAPGILRRKIRAEVERAMNEAGLSKASGRSLGGNGGTDGLPMGGDVLSSVRYELNKMQQELLRRQVLDPRHYAITSVDAVNHASQGLTVADINSFGLTGKKRKKITADDGTMGPVTLIERSMDIPTMIGDVRLFITVILDIDAMELRCTIQCSREDAFRHKLIDELPLGTDNKNITVEIATTRVSRLVFSKVAEHTLDELIHATTELKRKMLQNVSEILNQMIHDAGVPHGDLVFTVDRSLCSKRFSEDSVLVDLVISRNEDCNGVLIRVTPLAGLFQTNVGPVILHLSDHELEVLLIAQHSLFEKGMEKWTSMETVAQWLANKVIIKKVATTTTRPLMSTKRTITSASGKLNSSMLRSLELGRTSTIREEDNESVASQLTLSARGRDEEDDALSVNTDTMMANPKVLLLLDVKIDTKIELAQTLIDTWRATNVPKLIGLTMVMEAWQDLDVMVISVKLIIPSRKTHKRLMHDAKRHNYDDDDASGDGNGQGLMDMDNYSDDGNYDYDTGDPTVIDYEYRLTRAELLTFGSTSMIEHKKVSLSKNRQTQHDEHPENMLWNVLNRLKVSFSGSSADPYKSTASAADPANWSLSYDRQILRDVKTVSNTAVILTVTVHGGELLIEGERVESKHSSKIGSKRVAEDELQSFVYEEGYTLQLLKYQRRKELATHLLNSLKLVDDADYPHRLELYTFVESKMITIALAATLHEPEEELGSIEINSHHTLNDVRIIMKYEFEIHQIPPQFRFIYKGSECSLRQETFRRAWECLPTLTIVSKVLSLKEMGTETEDMVQRRLLAKPKKVAVEQIARVPKGMRRMPGKYAPIPLPTLCAVTEGRNQVFLLHNATTLLNPGDIIRIGNVTGRDYVVMSVGFQGEGDVLNMHMIEIDPLYDLIGEPDFHLPTQSNLAWPQKHAGTVMKDFVKRVRIIKRPGELGFIYNWQGEKNIKPVSIARESTELQSTGNNPTLMLTTGGGGPLNATGMTATNGLNASASMVFPQDSAMTLVSPSKLNASGTAGAGESSAKVGGLLENSVAMGGDDQSVNSQDGGGTTMVVGSSTNDYIPGTKRKGKKKIKIRKFTDCWIWKCIPAQDDQRLKWRQNYDDGLVHYGYEFGQSEEFFQHFRVKAWYSYLEVLCTDSRVPEFTIHHQRVHEMPSFSLDYYTKLAFDRITEWTPSYKKGIERMKFIKLIKDVTAFPDLKRPARIAQLDMYFQKVVKSEYGIVQKYINYHGFCYLLKLISLVRFPPKRKREEKENDDDDASVGKDQKNGKDDDDQSQMTDDLSVGSLESESSLKGKKGDKAASRPSRNKRDKGAAKSTTSSRVGKGSGREDKSVDDNASSVGGADPTRQIDIEHVNYAYQKFILDYIMMYPTWYDTPWRDAKLLAMRKEAVRYCAATRLAAMWRGYFHRQEYLFFLRQHIKLQANIRRKLSAHRTRDMIALLEEDWYFRQRYYYATMITKIVRRFLKRCWYHRMIDSIRRQQVLLMKARRQKFKQIKDSSKKTKMYSEAKRLSGVFVIINVYRKDPRNYTKDFGVIIQVYVPVTQQKITFVVEDEELRSYMAVALEVDVVTTGQILDRRNLKKMISQRLIVHKASKKSALPIITFSKHALGQRGEKTMTCAKRIMGERFVAKIFETVEDLAVQMYHQVSCKVFTCVMEMHELRAWIREEHILTVRATGADELVVNSDPIELHPKRKLELYDWVLKHLVIDTRRGTFKVVWSNQYEKSRKREMIVKIQSVWRRALVRPIIVAKLDKFMLRVKLSAWDESSYYINLNTGGTQWEKPKLLGPQELPTIPTRRWVPVNYPDSYVQYYVNPFTGKFTYLVPDRAARIIQSLIRNHLLKTIQMTRENYLKAGKIFMQAEKQYQLLHGQHKLSAVINFALYKHVLEIDEPGAKEIYREAVDLSESNPLVTRAYAFYIMATCENPIQLNRDRALILLLDARRKDPENVKFVTAYAIFQFAVLRQPRDFRTLINLAMVHCLLYNENYKAEKLLRRALAIAPFEERVIEVWKFLKDRFPERHLVYNPKSRVHQINQSKSLPVAKRKVVHGRPVLENIEWAGWVFVEEDIYHVSKIYKTGSYWYNPADGTETDDMPDFKDQWRVRRERSQWIGEEFGMDQYYDPLTAEYFQHHTLTDTYS